MTLDEFKKLYKIGDRVKIVEDEYNLGVLGETGEIIEFGLGINDRPGVELLWDNEADIDKDLFMFASEIKLLNSEIIKERLGIK